MTNTPYTIECDRDGMWVCRIERADSTLSLTVHRNARRAAQYGSAMTGDDGSAPCPTPWTVLA